MTRQLLPQQEGTSTSHENLIQVIGEENSNNSQSEVISMEGDILRLNNLTAISKDQSDPNAKGSSSSNSVMEDDRASSIGRECVNKLKSKVSNLISKELDEIDAEFATNHHSENLIIPDGIQIMVDRDEEQQFDDQLDYDDLEAETVYPVPPSDVDNDSDADTVEGEGNILNTSTATSNVISFKDCANDMLHCTDKDRVISRQNKNVSEMSPDELMEANPAL